MIIWSYDHMLIWWMRDIQEVPRILHVLLMQAKSYTTAAIDNQLLNSSDHHMVIWSYDPQFKSELVHQAVTHSTSTRSATVEAVKYQNTWTSDHMFIWAFIRMIIWSYDHMIIWTYDHMIIRSYDQMIIRPWRVLKKAKVDVLLTLFPWKCSTMVQNNPRWPNKIKNLSRINQIRGKDGLRPPYIQGAAAFSRRPLCVSLWFYLCLIYSWYF